MKSEQESGPALDKAAVDASTPGSLTISIDPSTRGGIQPATIGEAVQRIIQTVQQERSLFVAPLRLVVVTAEIGEAAKYWQRALGLPEAGTSDQPEGKAAGKHISWGSDAESARSIIILADYIAAGLVANEPLMIACLVHELGHVMDDFARGVVIGFQNPQSPRLNDWPGISAYIAESVWSEFAAETFAVDYFTPKILTDFVRSDRDYLLGVHHRLRHSILSHRLGEIDFHEVWSRAVTDLCNIFSNLGRGVARLSATDCEDALTRFVDSDSEAVCWKPVIERLIRELHALATKGYMEWGDEPFCGLKQAIASGFEAAGFFPTCDSHGLRVNLR